MTPDEKFADALSEITGRRIDVPKAEADIDAIDAADPITAEMTRLNAVFQARFAAQAKAREEKHQKDSINALERLLFAHGDEAHTRGHRYDRARRALVEAIDDWNRLQPLLALPRLEDGPVQHDIDTMQEMEAPMPDTQERGKVLEDTVMRNMYLTAQVDSQQAEIRALHEVMRAINTAMITYEDEACLSGYTVVAPPKTAAE
jgi:hypothetical protein